jgi:N12 class adenine-specific DNA methylase
VWTDFLLMRATTTRISTLYTKMRNVGGIAQTEAQKSSDLFMKCRYLDELTGGRGTVFATGTPISNSMVELYTIQRYLQYNTLVKNNLQHFDAWASTFGETSYGG